MKPRDRLLLCVPATPSAVGLIRAVTANRLRQWNCTHIADDVVLVASELTTNAVKATPRRHIRYRLARDADTVVTAVWDASPELPSPRPPGDLPGGRGLLIVAALAVDNGWSLHPQGGKWVWARMKH